MIGVLINLTPPFSPTQIPIALTKRGIESTSISPHEVYCSAPMPDPGPWGGWGGGSQLADRLSPPNLSRPTRSVHHVSPPTPKASWEMLSVWMTHCKASWDSDEVASGDTLTPTHTHTHIHTYTHNVTSTVTVLAPACITVCVCVCVQTTALNL